MTMHGEYRLRTLDAAAFAEEKRKHAGWIRDPDPAKVYEAYEEIMASVDPSADSGWLDNIVTDYARRYMLINGIGSGQRLFIHQNTIASNVRVTTIQNTYTDGASSQVKAAVTTTLDDSLLLQIRITQFPQPTVPRTVNLVGMTPATDITAAQRAVNGVMSYTKLTSPIVQQPTEVANLQHRLTWSLG